MELRRAFLRYLFYEGISPTRAFTPRGGKCFTTNEGLLREGKAECECGIGERERERGREEIASPCKRM
jgi:hypothetical protein